MDGSATILNIASTGERKRVNYADRPCRLNTYGHSFTQCNQVRPDQEFVDFLRVQGIWFVDGLEKHRAAFLAFRVSPRAYADRFSIGRYIPLGNHFFTFAIKGAVVDWLDPKPSAYRQGTDPFGSVSPL